MFRMKIALGAAALVLLVPTILLLVAGCRAPEVALCDAPPDYRIEEKEHTFVAFGDCQQSPFYDWFLPCGPKERAQVRKHIKELRPDLVLLAGDVVAQGSCAGYWRQWRREYEGMTIYPVFGNHDLYGPKNACLNNFFAGFPHLAHSRWYSIHYGPMLVLMLDANRGRMTRGQWKSQIEWMKAELETADADPTVRCVALMTHQPPISASLGGGTCRVKREMYDVAARHAKFRLFISGHHHDYQHLRDGDRHAFVTGGGGGVLFYARFGNLPKGTSLVRARCAHHVLFCRANDERVRIEMHELHPDGSWSVEESTDIPY